MQQQELTRLVESHYECRRLGSLVVTIHLNTKERETLMALLNRLR
jgi:hypothetical protein